MNAPTAADFLVGNIEELIADQGPDRIRRRTKADYFRHPENFFGMTVTDVAETFGPHWHPNADEFDYFLRGKGRVGVVKTFKKVGDQPPEETLVEFPVKAGDLIVIPQGYAHYYINDGVAENPLQFLAVFNNADFRVVNAEDVPEIAK